MSDSPATFQIRLFGGFDVRVDGKPLPALRSKREQWLLAILVLRNGRDTSREWLSSTLWPDNDEEQALFYLRKALSNLRKALGSEASRLLSPSARTLRLDLEGASADVVRFDDAKGKDPVVLTEAVALYKGPLLPDFQEEWAMLERSEREQVYLGYLEALARQSDPTGSVRWLRLIITTDPYRESAYRDLMQALADCGDRAAVTVVYRELQTKLHNDLHSSPAPETEALFKELRERAKQAVVSPTQSTASPNPRRHLPVPLTDLIGRKNEIEQILGWFDSRRLVSLVGGGGIGKTRLAIAIAEAAMPLFDQGVWFVDLAPVNEAALIPQAAARALGIAEERGRPLLDALKEALAPRNILVVLDNCEHLPDPCAEFAFALLTACPSLSIVATSRQPLHVTGEQVFRVPSLPVPPSEHTLEDVDTLMEFEAVRLFVDRGARVNDSFRLNARNSGDIVEICRQLDGIALAIEMAAARLRSISASEIKTRLSDRLRLLTSGNRGALPRQHTLRAAIDWSYDQLSEEERMLLRRVSVFSSGWTLEAAEAVGRSQDTLDLLDSLVDKSLVVVEPRGEHLRYRLLETVRQYGDYRLAEVDERNSIRVRHLAYFVELAERIEPRFGLPRVN